MDGTSFRGATAAAIQTCVVKKEIHRCMSLCLKTNIDSLSNDLLFDILLLLPSDFLYERARFVCRKWYNIIHSDDFTNAQIPRSTNGLLLSSRLGGHPNIYVTSIHGRIQTHELTSCRTEILASCNGLVLELHIENGKDRSLHVTNPATKQPFLLPPLPNNHVYHQGCGFAYSPASMQHKLTLPYFDCCSYDYKYCCWHEYSPLTQRAGLCILTAGVDKSWRNVPIHHLSKGYIKSILCQAPLTTEGFLHWATGIEVVTLNVETETFTFTKIPGSYFTQSGGRYLSALCGGSEEFVWEIWEMKPESGEWRNVLPLRVDLRPLKCRLQQFAASRRHHELFLPLGWVEYPEILAFRFWDEGRICFFYHLDTHEMDTIEYPESNILIYRAFTHKNSPVYI